MLGPNPLFILYIDLITVVIFVGEALLFLFLKRIATRKAVRILVPVGTGVIFLASLAPGSYLSPLGLIFTGLGLALLLAGVLKALTLHQLPQTKSANF